MSLLPEPPLVVGTVGPEGLAALAASPRGVLAPDIIEARFDLAAEGGGNSGLPDPRWYFAPCRRLEDAGSPILSTIRVTADGGRWTSDEERLPWFEQALDITSWVDIEIGSAIAVAVVAAAHARARRAIVSHHDFAGTPDAAALDAIVERGRSLGGDIIKIATMVATLDDHDRLIDLLRRQRAARGSPLAIIGMGAAGIPLRTYLPSVGSRLTYGYLDQPAAPGQIPAGDLVARLLRDCPQYASHRRGKAHP